MQRGKEQLYSKIFSPGRVNLEAWRRDDRRLLCPGEKQKQACFRCSSPFPLLAAPTASRFLRTQDSLTPQDAALWLGRQLSSA